MKHFLSVFFCAAAMSVAYAQESRPLIDPNPFGHYRNVIERFPIGRCGTFIGRSGTAFGPSVVCEVSLLRRWLGVYGLAAVSRVDGYQSEGATATETDHSLGLGFRFLPFRFGDFYAGGFGQAVYSGSHVTALYSDADGSGTVLQFTESARNPMTTVGADLEYHLPRGLWIVARVGRNLGDGFGATTAGGFYFNGGMLFDFASLARGFNR